MECFNELVVAPRRITMPDNPEPASFGLTKHYYPTIETIVDTIASMFAVNIPTDNIRQKHAFPHDIPGDWFKGPF